MNLDLSNDTFGLTNSETLSGTELLVYWINHGRKLGPWAFRIFVIYMFQFFFYSNGPGLVLGLCATNRRVYL